jgi:hypothetical protein
MTRKWYPLELPDSDLPQPCTAPNPEAVDAVSMLNMLRDRIPLLIHALHQVHQDVPGMLLEELTGEMSPDRWLALAALCDEPAQIMSELAEVCRQQAEDARRQIEADR